jgi:hypothetical protein
VTEISHSCTHSGQFASEVTGISLTGAGPRPLVTDNCGFRSLMLPGCVTSGM